MSAATTSEYALAEQESLRLHALGRFQITGTAPEERFDAIARLAARLFRTPIAYVSLIDQHWQWLKAQTGLGPVGLDQGPTPRSASFCTHTIRSNDVLVIPDTQRDPRFIDNPRVVGLPFVRFYAGAPLITADGFRLGALCVADTAPRGLFPAHDRQALADLAAMVVEQMTLRRSELARLSMMGFANATELALLALTREGRIRFANRAAASLFGYDLDEMLGAPFELIVPEDRPRVRDLFERLVDHPEHTGSAEFRVRRGDGLRTWIHAVLEYADDDGSADGRRKLGKFDGQPQCRDRPGIRSGCHAHHAPRLDLRIGEGLRDGIYGTGGDPDLLQRG